MDKLDDTTFLNAIIEMVQRAPKTNAECIGCEYAIVRIKAALGELNEYRNRPSLTPEDK